MSIENENELFLKDLEDWPSRLRKGVENRDQAIYELRRFLMRGLSKSLLHRYGGKIQIDDVAQVALMKILDSLESFQARSRFTTWAMSIATRIGISELRRQHYRDVSLDQTTAKEDLRHSIQLDEQHANKQALFVLLHRLIDEYLSDKQRVAIRGSLDGLPIEEIAIRLGSNRNAVYKLVHDARLRLRQGFEANGVHADDIASTIL